MIDRMLQFNVCYVVLVQKRIHSLKQIMLRHLGSKTLNTTIGPIQAFSLGVSKAGCIGGGGGGDIYMLCIPSF
jgi:hypothetical protein